MPAQKAIFLDRDGVVNPVVYNSEFGTMDSPLNPEEFSLSEGIVDFMRTARNLGYLLFLVSNQPIIAKGKTSKDLFLKIHEKMNILLSQEGVFFDDVLYCFHHPDKKEVKVNEYLLSCDCRKPKPGMIISLAEKFNIDLKRSFMIGDDISDIKAGKNAGCKTIFLGNIKYYYFKKMEEDQSFPDFSVTSLQDAVNLLK